MMEACGAAHHWARLITGLGHKVRLIASEVVKRFVKPNFRTVADLTAAEPQKSAGSRSHSRFVVLKMAAVPKSFSS